MATCLELRAQLAVLQTQADNLDTEVLSDQGDLKELQSESQHVNPTIIANAQKRLADHQAQLDQVNAQIADLRNQQIAQKCLFQPQEILQIQFTNPAHMNEVDALFAQGVALGQLDPSGFLGGTFPSRDAQQEWKQTLPASLTDTAGHNADYEGANLVGASGWALDPRFSGADVPFTHPFGLDFECMLALDQPPNDPNRFTFLLTVADQSCDEERFDVAVAQAGDFQDSQGKPIIPLGPDGLPNLLGVEIDGGIVPKQFSEWQYGGVDQGDRVAVFGRWIVDCGHQIPVTRCDVGHTDVHPGLKAFRTEIHPPLLMAAARVAAGSLASPSALASGEFTRVIVTSRPYLVGQTFTTDTGNIYDDSQPDDGPFFGHMIKEVVKVHETLLGIPTASIQVEAHPKIKSDPFNGSYEMHLIVRPPSANQVAGGAVSPGTLAVAFQFTVRNGCSVQVTPSGTDGVDIAITLGTDGYNPPPLPQRNERTWTRDELGQLNPAAADAYITAEEWTAGIHALFPQLGGIIGAGIATAILEQGIQTDEYDTSGLTAQNILDGSRAVTGPASNIPGTDFRAQLDALLKEMNSLTIEVQSDKGDLQELQSESQHVNPTIIANAQKRLAAAEAQLKQVNDQIAALNSAGERGVLHNDSQPFPVFGWLEVGFMPPQAHP
jgi:hypothetical protein